RRGDELVGAGPAPQPGRPERQQRDRGHADQPENSPVPHPWLRGARAPAAPGRLPPSTQTLGPALRFTSFRRIRARLAAARPILRVVHQREQRAHRAVGARIAEAALLADAERPAVAVVAVAVHELGRGEHGLAVALRRLARGLGVAAILALVVGDDPLET